MVILIGLFGLIIGLIIAYLLPKEKVRKYNQELDKQETEIQFKIKDLEKEYLNTERQYKEKERTLEDNYKEKERKLEKEFLKDKEEKEQQIKTAQQELAAKEQEWKNKEFAAAASLKDLEHQRSTVNDAIEAGKKLTDQIKNDAKTLENTVYDLMVKEISAASNKIQIKYKEQENIARTNYKELTQDLLQHYQELETQLDKKYQEASNRLQEEQAKAVAAIEVNKRTQLEKSQKDFYRLQIPQIDLEEIKRLRAVEPYLRDKEPLNKVIYKSYYEKPYTDLIGRIFGTRKPSGIYKITNLQNGMCYIGQAINVPERWRQHIKRGVGAEPATQNKLYPVMKKEGIENFMFELIEECKAIDLTPREKFWTDFYEGQSYGYNIKKG